MKFVNNYNIIIILFEIILLITLWTYFLHLGPDGIIIHKTGTTADFFSNANYLFLKGIEYLFIYLLCSSLLTPLVGIKNFIKILPFFFIFGLYVFNALVIGILSLNINNIFIYALRNILLFFTPILAIYFILCIVIQLIHEIKK